MSEVGEISVKISSDTASFDRGTKRVQDGTRDMGADLKKLGTQIRGVANNLALWGSAAATASAVAGAAITKAALTNIRELRNLANAAGLSVTELQRGAFAAEQFGISQEKYGDILKDINDRVGDFVATGAGPMADFFEKVAPKVGVTADQFKKLNSQESLGLYIKTLEDANVSQQEMTFYLEAMASDATRLLPLFTNNGKALGEMADQAEALGIGLSQIEVDKALEAQAAMGRIGKIIDSEINKAVAGLSPLITQVAEDLQKAFGGESLNPDELIDGVETIATGIAYIGNAIVGWQMIIAKTKMDFAEFFADVTEYLQPFAKAMAEIANKILGIVRSLLKKLADLIRPLASEAAGEIDKIFDGLKDVQVDVNMFDEIAADAKKSAADARAEFIKAVSVTLPTDAVEKYFADFRAKQKAAAAERDKLNNKGTGTGTGGEVEEDKPTLTLADIMKAETDAVKAELMKRTAELQAIQVSAYDAELNSLKSQLDAGLISRNDYAEQEKQIERQKADAIAGIATGSFAQIQTALAQNRGTMQGLQSDYMDLINQISNNELSTEQAREALEELKQKMLETKTEATALGEELRRATSRDEEDQQGDKLDPVAQYQQETIGLLEALGLRNASMEEAQLAANMREQEMLAQQYAAGEISEQDHSDKMANLKRNAAETERNIVLSNVQDGFKLLAAGSKKVQKLMEGVAIVNAVIKGKEAAVAAWSAGMATGGPFAPVVAAAYTAASIAKTGSMIAAIKSGGKGSGGGGGGSVPSAAAAGGGGGGASSGGGGNAGPTRIFNVDFLGDSNMSTKQTRNLLELINEQAGDNVEINLRG